ncbi:MAG: hypothetical protein ALAOOOJD_04189 [bacterium]|nr:hypothetical protein [bacterium]
MSCAYHDRLAHIADYVRGELPESEQENFEIHYLACDECLKAVRFLEKTAFTIHHYGADIFATAQAPAKTKWLDHLNTWWEDIPLSQQWKAAIPAFATYVVVVCMLALGYSWVDENLKLSAPSLNEKSSKFMPEVLDDSLVEWQHYDWQQPVTATDDTALYNRLVNVRTIYQARRYHLAADQLAVIVQDHPQADAARLFLGISQFHLRHPTAAIQNLEQVLQSSLELSPEHSAARWHLAQCYLLQSKFDAARQQLTALVKTNDAQFSALAKASMGKLNRQHK